LLKYYLMTKAELEQTIKDIEGGIASPSVPEKFKVNMRSQLEMLKGKLAEMTNKPAEKKKTSVSKMSTSASGGNDISPIDLYEDYYVKGYENSAMNFAYVPDFKGVKTISAYSMGLSDGKSRNKKSFDAFEKAINELPKTTSPKRKSNDKSFMSDFREKKKPEDARVIAEYLIDQFNKGMDEMELEDSSDVLGNQEKQEKLIKFLNRRIVPFYKEDGLSEDVRDILEDENYHLLNEYLGLSGLYGAETQKYYLTFKKKHGGADWKKKQLNPEYFGLKAEADEPEPKKKGVPLPKDKQSNEDDYDCDELIEKEKQRRAKAKERALKPKKTEATKNKEKLEKVFENVKERAMEEEVSKAELEKLISSTETLLKMLKDKLAKFK